ncbi:MAG: hypothetical protein QOI39_615 [Mycobacterium sp.]|nr:hypothetical protein [Mycobacterium sp.]
MQVALPDVGKFDGVGRNPGHVRGQGGSSWDLFEGLLYDLENPRIGLIKLG